MKLTTAQKKLIEKVINVFEIELPETFAPNIADCVKFQAK